MRAPPPGSFSATMRPALGLDDLGHDGQAEARAGQAAGGRRAVEAVEDVGQVLLGDAGAVVVHARPCRPGTRPRPARPAGSTCGRCRAGCPRPGAARRRWPPPSTARPSSSKCTSLERPWVFWTATSSCTSRSRRSGSRERRAPVAPGQLGQVAHDVGELLQLHQDVVDQHGAVLGAQLVDPADHLEVGAQAGERRAQLVGGVEHQLALGPARRLERLEQAVEGAPEAAQLVGAARREPACHVGRLGQVLDRVGERLSGTSAVRATSQPRTTASRTPTRATAPSSSASFFSCESTLSSVAICSAPPSTRRLARVELRARRAGARRTRASGSRRR